MGQVSTCRPFTVHGGALTGSGSRGVGQPACPTSPEAPGGDCGLLEVDGDTVRLHRLHRRNPLAGIAVFLTLYLRSLVAFLNGTVLLEEFGHLAPIWTEPLIPWAGSITLILFLPFFFVAVPAVEEVRGKLHAALVTLDTEIAALAGALDGAVDPELVEARQERLTASS
jgi:hypothetical protein